MTRVKHISLLVILVVLFLPMIQKPFPLVNIESIKGSFIPAEEPELTLSSYLNGAFQEKYNTYLEQNIGFRPLLVRINNQINFSFFNMTNANYVVVGKNNYLYEENYINAYLGHDFLGREKWEEKIRKIVFVGEELKKRKIDLVFILAPGKATFFPEYIPDEYNTNNKSVSNHEYLLKAFEREGINYIDFNTWFSLMKDTATYPLYPQCGIHWSAYGVALAIDSIKGFVESLKGKKMIKFGWNGFDFPDTLRSPDYDIAEGMNLFFTIPHYKMAYPILYFREDSLTYKPNVLTIADSYYWNLFGPGISQRFYSHESFWYYSKVAYSKEYPSGVDVEGLNLKEEIEKQDVVFILATEANLYKLAYGFIDSVYDLYSNGSLANNEESRIQQIENVIRADSAWYQRVKEKAKKRDISVDEMIRFDALWMLQKKDSIKRGENE